LGSKLNVTNTAVSRWETGRGLPDSSLLLPLAKELGVTVDEILRGEFVVSEVELNTKTAPCVEIQEKGTRIQRQNAALDFIAIKKQLLRDSIVVIPTFIFICVWLYIGLNPNIDLTPNADYKTSFIINLLVPLMIIGAAQLVYASFLITDSIRMQGKKWYLKLFICIGIYYAVVHLFLAVYIYRTVRFLVLKNRMKKNL
jgi:transcriptional regulator with XRE-family HTH domain